MAKKTQQERAREGAEEVLRQYIKLLLGQRKQQVLAGVLGLKRQAVGAIVNGERKVMPEHLVKIGKAWNIPPHRMFADIAIVAMNMAFGRPLAENLGGDVVSASTSTGTAAGASSRQPGKAAGPAAGR